MTRKTVLTPVPDGIGGGSAAPRAREFYEAVAVDVLARTLWGEARGEGERGMTAVACVVVNRARIAAERGGFWWGRDIVEVCQKPQQFSCWNRADPNFKIIQTVDEADLYFATAVRIARRAVAGVLGDVTGGATHYHANSITPYWAKEKRPVTVIGRHLFYKLV